MAAIKLKNDYIFHFAVTDICLTLTETYYL